MGFARSSWFAVGDTSGGEDEDEAGWAISTDVKVVRRGIEAESSASNAVWRR